MSLATEKAKQAAFIAIAIMVFAAVGYVAVEVFSHPEIYLVFNRREP